MARRSGLGKGLGALIPSDVGGQADAIYQQIPLSSVSANKYQPREHFDEDELRALTASITEVGVLQPILVRAIDEDHFELIAGERRWRAAKRAGLRTIPAIVRETEDRGALEQALVENLHRADLSPLEEAAAYQQLVEEFGLTQDAVAQRVGKSRSAVSNTLRLFQLPPTVQKYLADGRLSAGHARALLATPDRTRQEALAAATIAEDWSVRELERQVREGTTDGGGGSSEGTKAKPHGEKDSPAARGAVKAPALLELERLLEDYLESTVSVTMGSGRGKITIAFADLDDLERIYRTMIES